MFFSFVACVFECQWLKVILKIVSNMIQKLLRLMFCILG